MRSFTPLFTKSAPISGIKWFLDSPAVHLSLVETALGKITVVIQGWLITANPMQTIAIKQGEQLFSLPFNMDRPDVLLHVYGTDKADKTPVRCGFKHKLILNADEVAVLILEDGSQQNQLCSISFTEIDKTVLSGQLKVAVGAIVKNELPYLKEWIAYHRVLGVDHFVIADNNSTDGTFEFLKQLQKQGIVETFRFPTLGEQAPQLPAYRKILSKIKGRYDLVAFLDADEFIAITQPDLSLKHFLADVFSNQEISSLVLNWACFGSSGHLFKEEGNVISRFTQHGKNTMGQNKHYKTIVRPDKVKKFYNPHMVELKSGIHVDAQKQLLQPCSRKPFGLSEHVIWSPVRINHYIVKSLEEFLVRKSPNGSAARVGKIKHKKYFTSHDKNDLECLAVASLNNLVEQEMVFLSNLSDIDKPNNWMKNLQTALKMRILKLRQLYRGFLMRRYSK